MFVITETILKRPV